MLAKQAALVEVLNELDAEDGQTKTAWSLPSLNDIKGYAGKAWNTANSAYGDVKSYAQGGVPNVALEAAKKGLPTNPVASRALTWGGIGALGGGLLGGLSELSKDPEDRTYGSSILTGALAGGVGGSGIGALSKVLPQLLGEMNTTNKRLAENAKDPKTRQAQKVLDDYANDDYQTAGWLDVPHRLVNSKPALFGLPTVAMGTMLARDTAKVRSNVTNALPRAIEDAISGKKQLFSDGKLDQLKYLQSHPDIAAKVKADAKAIPASVNAGFSPKTWNQPNPRLGDPVQHIPPISPSTTQSKSRSPGVNDTLTHADILSVLKNNRASRFARGAGTTIGGGLASVALPWAVTGFMGNRAVSESELARAQKILEEAAAKIRK